MREPDLRRRLTAEILKHKKAMGWPEHEPPKFSPSQRLALITFTNPPHPKVFVVLDPEGSYAIESLPWLPKKFRSEARGLIADHQAGN